MSSTGTPKQLRICLWAPVPPPDGGISRWTARYCNEAPRFGLDVAVVDTSPRAAGFTERSSFSFGRAGTAFRALGQLWKILRRHKPDAAHITTTLFWATPRDALALWLCRLYGVPTVLNIRASTQIVAWREALGKFRRFLLDLTLRSASVTVVLSEELKTYLERHIAGLNVCRIPNMIAATELASGNETLSRLLPARRTSYRVLYVGFRTPLKGIGDLADAVLALPDCELVVAGDAGGAIDPALQGKMENSLQALRNTGRLIETGVLTPDQVTALYRQVEIFVLPSYREGLPNVLLEAMAAGLPCIATPVGAIPDVLTTGCGIIVPVGDPAALRDAIQKLNRDPSLRTTLGGEARRRIQQCYSVDVVMDSYRTLYAHLTGR